MRPGDCGRKDQTLQHTRVGEQGRSPGYLPSRVSRQPQGVGPWRPTTSTANGPQRSGCGRLARRVGIFQHHRMRKAPSLTGTNHTPRRRPPAGSRYL